MKKLSNQEIDELVCMAKTDEKAMLKLFDIVLKSFYAWLHKHTYNVSVLESQQMMADLKSELFIQLNGAIKTYDHRTPFMSFIVYYFRYIMYHRYPKINFGVEPRNFEFAEAYQYWKDIAYPDMQIDDTEDRLDIRTIMSHAKKVLLEIEFKLLVMKLDNYKNNKITEELGLQEWEINYYKAEISRKLDFKLDFFANLDNRKKSRKNWKNKEKTYKPLRRIGLLENNAYYRAYYEAHRDHICELRRLSNKRRRENGKF